MMALTIGALIFLALIPAEIASRKGHPFLLWYVYGLLLFILAVPSALLLKPNTKRMRKCPHCRDWIDNSVACCPSCGETVTPLAEPRPQKQADLRLPLVGLWLGIAALVAMIAVGYVMTG